MDIFTCIWGLQVHLTPHHDMHNQPQGGHDELDDAPLTCRKTMGTGTRWEHDSDGSGGSRATGMRRGHDSEGEGEGDAPTTWRVTDATGT
jgi:hypothetical protein